MGLHSAEQLDIGACDSGLFLKIDFTKRWGHAFH